MALEHALLVALSERPASGLELTRRFEKSLGFFWHATHQQIYRVLARMEADGWVSVEVVAQDGPPDKRVHTAVGRAGGRVLAEWLADADADGDLPQRAGRQAARGVVRRPRGAARPTCWTPVPTTQTRLAHYEQLEREQFPDPSRLDGPALDQWLVLRGGIRLEQLLDRLDHRVPARPTRRTDMTHPRYPHLLAPITLGAGRRADPAQPRRHGLDAHRARGPPVGHRQAGGVLRRARPRRRRPDHHRRLRAHQARLAQAVRLAR